MDPTAGCDMPSTEILATIASIVTAAGVTMLFFRISRELAIQECRVRGHRPPELPAVGALPWRHLLRFLVLLRGNDS